jgi:hypothetical protein
MSCNWEVNFYENANDKTGKPLKTVVCKTTKEITEKTGFCRTKIWAILHSKNKRPVNITIRKILEPQKNTVLGFDPAKFEWVDMPKQMAVNI